MKKIFFSWLIPLIVALVFVTIARVFLFSAYVINNNSMSPNLCEGDIALCIKKVPKKRNKIVLCRLNSTDSMFLKRQIAIPGDTLAIKRGTIIVNGHKLINAKGVIDNYVFNSDSINAVSKYLIENELSADIKKASLGFFDCYLTNENIARLDSVFSVSSLKRKSLEPKIRFVKGPNFGKELYWNYDNLGSIIIPKKGLKIRLGKKSFLLYKSIIEQESGQKAKLLQNKVFFGERETPVYTFKHSYVFLVNDNRSNFNDSRILGLVPTKNLVGTFLFRLPKF